MTSPRALVIAGLDPSAGAGLVLDAFVFARLGYAPCTVATTVTAQNSSAFRRAVPVESDLLGDQIEAMLAEGRFACVKVGAGGSAGNAMLLAGVLGGLGAPVVVDPVLASSSGGDLVDHAAMDAIETLCSVATVITPNAEEALRLARISGTPGWSVARGGQSGSMACEAGCALSRRWGCTVVVTGVTAESGSEAADVVCVRDSAECLAHPLVPGVGDVRGTGCMFSSSLAAGLGAGRPVREAVTGAQREVSDLLQAAARLGRGRLQVDLGAIGWAGSVRGLPASFC